MTSPENDDCAPEGFVPHLHPPLLRGGQGRDEETLLRDADPLVAAWFGASWIARAALVGYLVALALYGVAALLEKFR